MEFGKSSLKMSGEALEQLPTSSDDEKSAVELGTGELHLSHAASQLKALLQKHGQEIDDSLLEKRNTLCSNVTGEEHRSVSVNDLVPITLGQSQYIHHLEAEVKFCKEELSAVKQQVHLVVLENEELHEQLKSRMLQSVLREQTLLEASTESEKSSIIPKSEKRKNQQDFPEHNSPQVLLLSSNDLGEQKWKIELDKLQLLHQAKTETLESQIMSLRMSLADSQKKCEEFQTQLKQQKCINTARSSASDVGLYANCAQNEAVLSQEHENIHRMTIERLTRERDELMDALVSMKRNLVVLQQKELKPYMQVTQAVEMTEEANMEKTKALINCEQLRNEIERNNRHFEKEMALQFEKMSAEKEAIRADAKKERDELAVTIKSLSQNLVKLEGHLERVTKEKNSMSNQLEEFQKLLSSREEESTRVYGEMCYQLNQIKMKKEEAEKAQREYRKKTITDLEIKDQVIEKLELQLNENKQCLEQAQQDATRAKDECLKLTELLGNAEHQLHLTRLEKDGIQHSLSSEIRSAAFRAQKCEEELKQKIQQMEAQHDQTVNDMDSLMTSQNTLISELKKECRVLAQRLEHLIEKNSSEIQHITQENIYVRNRLEKQQKRNDELETQCIQHGIMHEKMQARLQQLDKHCKNNALRIVDLLSKNNELLKERKMLTEEVQLLRKQTQHQNKEISSCFDVSLT
ncbi:serologically defined colon cancer antigen 8 [Rhinophrynus dorsalis]